MIDKDGKQDAPRVRGLAWAMVFLALFVAFSFQGTRGLYDTTEGRYAECAREMVETGNYLEPTLAYRPSPLVQTSLHLLGHCWGNPFIWEKRVGGSFL